MDCLSPAIEAKENLFFGNAKDFNNPPLNFGKFEHFLCLENFKFHHFFIFLEIETKPSNNNSNINNKFCRLCSMSRKKFMCKKCLQNGVFSSNSSEERYEIVFFKYFL